AETPGDVDVRVDPAGQDCEAPQVVVNGRGIRIERHDLRAFDNDARVASDLAAPVEQHTRADNDAPLLCLDRCGILLRARADDEDRQEAENNTGASDR